MYSDLPLNQAHKLLVLGLKGRLLRRKPPRNDVLLVVNPHADPYRTTRKFRKERGKQDDFSYNPQSPSFFRVFRVFRG